MKESSYDNPFSASLDATGASVGRPAATAPVSEETKKRLDGAKWALVVIGVLTIGVNIFLIVNANKEVASLVQQEGGDGDALGAELLLTFVRVFYGLGIFLGMVYIGLGMLVYRFPVFCPLAGLVLYAGAAAIFGILEPMSLVRGIIIKIVVLVALFKAVKAGFAYRREQREAYDRMFGVSSPAPALSNNGVSN